MDDNLIFRIATPQEDEKILKLYKQSFNRELKMDWWKWYSYQCPTGVNRTYVIEDTKDGSFAGSYSLLPIKLFFNGKITNASLCTNVNTRPEYQGKGLFVKIGHFSLDHEIDFSTPITVGMPNQKAYPGHMKVGWDIMCKLPFLVKKHCKTQKHGCHEITKFDESFDPFYEKISKKFSFIILKNHDFMNWRVVERPYMQYIKIVYDKGDDLQGYMILKHFDDQGYKKTHILDIHAENDDVLHELLAAAESYASKSDELNMWTNIHNPYQQYFLEQGFVEREGTDLLIIHYNYGEKTPAQPGNWWFCLADNDVY
ncbi:MAG TPA: GNAT family N-acetyltransferase [Candidatus Thermoplasmatota archaeon]|nr:GNAT family N-acetyltransferase [Candidatus Thermoplasmatota archaeon]